MTTALLNPEGMCHYCDKASIGIDQDNPFG